MMRNITLLIIAVVALLASAFLKAEEKPATDSAAKAKSTAAPKIDAPHLEFFEKQVRPLLVKHCYDCHADGEEDGGLSIGSREGLLTGGDSGTAIVPGKPEESLLIEAVRYKNEDMQMPPDGKLSPAELKVLEKWVTMGAPDPRERTVGHEPKKSMGMSVADGKDFWSFQPLANPEVPKVKNEKWVKTPIDAFILAKLEGKGLTASPRASKETLIRRLTYDLIGLPPTPQEIDDFLADESPEAFEKLTERLLASPQYGVRWGRHWLDVVRYADSNGLDENLAFGNAWRFRDYVIDAYNNDKPFDRFLVEQLAGDLLPESNRETLTATGFLVLGAKVLAEADRQKLRMDTVDEQLDTLGKTFMGMSLGCVRCHDHKFDPIMHKDYYALGAIFKNTETFAKTKTGAIFHWNEHSLATKEELESLKKVDAEIKKKKAAASKFKSTEENKLRIAARKNAVKYLLAATRFETSASLKDVAAIADTAGLHARMLHHCRLHLSYNKQDAFFKKWHELNDKKDLAGIEKHFQALFDQQEVAFAAAKKKDPKVKKLDDPKLQAAREALYDKFGFLNLPPKPKFAFDEKTVAEYDRLMEEARILESNAPDEPSVMTVKDGEIKPTLPIHIRGSHRNLGKPVAREFPEVMRTSLVRPVFRSNQSGRLEFAKWLANTSHPLTSRVYVNRIWRWHFGQGIVKSTDNFGVLGDRPSHPELLDWLSRRFMETGWSTKQMHRLIVSSNVYQMQSQNTKTKQAIERSDAAMKIDPENGLLWRFRIQRLEAEQIRDTVLAVSGRLDESLGGKSVPLRNRQFVFNHTSVDHTKYDSLRRAAYLPVIRNNVYTLFVQFDFPDPTMTTGSRNSTTVAPQSLLMLNSPMIMDSANSLAKILLEQPGDDILKINAAYRLTLGRTATEQESKRTLAFIQELTKQQNNKAENANAKQQAWALFCQTLFASNDFFYVR